MPRGSRYVRTQTYGPRWERQLSAVVAAQVFALVCVLAVLVALMALGRGHVQPGIRGQVPDRGVTPMPHAPVVYPTPYGER